MALCIHCGKPSGGLNSYANTRQLIWQTRYFATSPDNTDTDAASRSATWFYDGVRSPMQMLAKRRRTRIAVGTEVSTRGIPQTRQDRGHGPETTTAKIGGLLLR